ncbi:hypothetical protein EJB05_34616, partial [Eragrostis curvula]
MSQPAPSSPPSQARALATVIAAFLASKRRDECAAGRVRTSPPASPCAVHNPKVTRRSRRAAVVSGLPGKAQLVPPFPSPLQLLQALLRADPGPIVKPRDPGCPTHQETVVEGGSTATRRHRVSSHMWRRRALPLLLQSSVLPPPGWGMGQAMRRHPIHACGIGEFWLNRRPKELPFDLTHK